MGSVRLLRVLATVLLGVAIGQAGFGSGLIATLVRPPESEGLETAHSIVAYVLLSTTVFCALAAERYRRDGGPAWPGWSAGCLLGVITLQVTLGSLDILGAHVFLGVLLLCAVTTYCSYLWRHQPDATLSPGRR
ncbi:MAG: hypothetical protein ACRCYX_16235 [Dermatophilaceae bacterium]